MEAFQCADTPPALRAVGNGPTHRRHCSVVTLLDPKLHSQVTLAGYGLFRTVAVRCVRDLAVALKPKDVRAAILTARLVERSELAVLESAGHEFTGSMAIAISGNDSPDVDLVLALGACGVRHVLDLEDPEAFNRLRDLVAEAYGNITTQILDAVMPALAHATPDARFFLETLIRKAPNVSSVRALAQSIDVLPSTLMSRFFRARLPSPKRYLAETRILYAAALMEDQRLSVVEVANRLGYSSPQSFGRHLRQLKGLNARDFRYRFSLRSAVETFVSECVAPYQTSLASFVPIDRRLAGTRTRYAAVRHHAKTPD